MSEVIGAKLEKGRQDNGLTQEELAERTKFNLRYIRAAEDGRFEELPGAVFVKGFLRTCSVELGLDGDELVESYEQLDLVSPDHSPKLISMPLHKESSKPTIILYTASVIVLAIVATVYYFFGAAPQQVVETSIKTIEPSNERIKEPVEVIAGSLAVNENDKEVVEELVEEKKTTQPETITVVKPAPSAQEEAPAAATQKRKLKISASSDSWVKVVIDGNEEKEALLKQGESIILEAEKSFLISIGNVIDTTLTLDGEKVKLPPAPRNVISEMRIP